MKRLQLETKRLGVDGKRLSWDSRINEEDDGQNYTFDLAEKNIDIHIKPNLREKLFTGRAGRGGKSSPTKMLQLNPSGLSMKLGHDLETLLKRESKIGLSDRTHQEN